MSAFEYRAVDAKGRERKGLVEADTARHARQQLRDQGLTPLAVEETSGRRGPAGDGEPRVRRGGWLRVSATDLALLTRQLATLVQSGMPLEEALQAVGRQSEKGGLKRLILAVRARVLEGHTLAAALAEFPAVFPELYRATVAAGEESGHLDLVLERLADYTENRQQMRQKVGLALMYPALLTLMAIAIVIALLAYVVPQVVQVFSNIGQQLPPLTRGLIAVSGFLRDHGLLLLALLAAGGGGAAWLLKRPLPRRIFHRLVLRLPLVGRLARGFNTARFARTFSILAAAGVPVLEAMRIAAQVLSSLPMREAVEGAAGKVREGGAIHQALEASGHFPPMTVHLVASGEASGRLEAMLERAAIQQERELDTLTSALLGLFEPLLILVMGGLVLLIVLAILLPIFDLNQLVK